MEGNLMKLNRREFLKFLSAGAAGAVLAGIGGIAGPETKALSVATSALSSATSSSTSTLNHELSERHIWTVSGLVPGSKIRAGDVLAYGSRGFIRPALPGDRVIGFAVADATDDTVMAYLDAEGWFNA